MKIAIIGAGFTGSITARQLTAMGHQVTVFDKSRGRGGRMTTKRCDWGQFDMGASSLECKTEAEKRFLTELERNGAAHQWSANIYDNNQGTLTKRQYKADLFVFTPGMSAVCRYLLQDSKLQLSCRICHLQATDNGWMLWDENDCKYSGFDWVLVTAPWPQTQPIIAPHFSQLLPLNEEDWLPCWTAALRLKSAINCSVDMVFTDGPAQLMVKDNAKPLRKSENDIWVIQFNHQVSEALHKARADQVIPMATDCLSQVFADQKIQVEQSYQHFWRLARISPKANLPGVISDRQSQLAAAGDWSFGGSLNAAFSASNALVSLFD